MQAAERTYGYQTDNSEYKAMNDKNNDIKIEKANARAVRRQKRLMFRVLFMAAILLIVGIGFTAYGTSIKYDINETNAAIADLQTKIDDLNLQVTRSTSPETIEEKAINELGMEYPSASQFVYINPDDGIYTAEVK